MMLTCPKCRKQSPDDAAFCGFCGGAMQEEEAPPAGSKTVFGYGVDGGMVSPTPDEAAGEPPAEEPPAPEPPAEEPEPDPANTLPLNATTGPIDGKFQLGEVVERMRVGDIYACTNVETGDEQTLLLVDASVFPSPLDLERARRELKQMVKLDSDHIIKVRDYGKVGTDQLYIVTDAQPLTSLEALASSGSFSLAEAQYVIKSVGAGLSEAQKRGVIHRDIAPHNIVLDGDGNIRVRGFGVAPVIKRQVIGTPEYISPEQAKGRPVDQRSNIYNLGAMLYFLLAGEPPFASGSPDELMQKHQNEDPEPLATRRPDLDLPDKAGALILKALAKSSSRRHLTLRQFLREAESLMPLNESTVKELLLARASGEAPEEEARPAMESVDAGAATVLDMKPVIPDDDLVTAPMETVPPMEETQPPADEVDPARTLLDQKPVAMAEEPPAVEEPPPAPVEEPPPAVEEPPPAPVEEPPAVEEPPPAPLEEPPAPVEEPPPAPVEEPPAVEEPPPAPVEEPPPLEKPFEEPAELTKSVKEGPQTSGELSHDDGVALKRPEPVVPKDRSSFKAPKTKKKKDGFRETLWFVKGKAESESVDSGEAEEEPPAPVEPDQTELADKYKDDGSIGAEGAHELSLRTGKTQQMKKIDIPTGDIPGETMDDGEFISEMNRGRTITIWVIVFLVLAAIIGVVVFLLRGGDEAAEPKKKPAVEEKQDAVEESEPEEKSEEKSEEKAPEGKDEPRPEEKGEAKPDEKGEPKPEEKGEPKPEEKK